VPLSFIDTNILLYSNDDHDAAKQSIATRLIHDLYVQHDAVVSIQVLQEYAVNAIAKLKLAPEITRRRVELFSRFHVVIPQPEHVIAALDLQRLHAFSFWDAMIVQSARAANCAILYSEDMHAGQTIAGLTIINPFAAVEPKPRKARGAVKGRGK